MARQMSWKRIGFQAGLHSLRAPRLHQGNLHQTVAWIMFQLQLCLGQPIFAQELVQQARTKEFATGKGKAAFQFRRE